MSLGINATTPEGIILAADSRQSYRNKKGMARIGSDSASKIFKINNRIGLIVTGLAFLLEKGIPKNISNFVEEFKQKITTDKLSVQEISKEISNFFEEKYPYREQLEELPSQIEIDLKSKGCEVLEIKNEKYHIRFKFKDPSGTIKDGIAGVDQLQFILAGYNPDGTHQVYMIYIPGDEPKEDRSSQIKGKEFGASWIGQTDVVSRIVLGWDGRIGNLPFVQKAATEIGQPELEKQLRSLEYVIQWGTMALQDAVDFCVLVIQTTTAIQRFSDGIAGNPGDMPGVGGPVDVAIITPKKGFIWISKKRLTVNGDTIDLDEYKDIEAIEQNTLLSSDIPSKNINKRVKKR